MAENMYLDKKDLKPKTVTYGYAQKKAMEEGDAPTYFMRKTDKRKTVKRKR